jgi:hypothetical protein
MSDEQRKDDGIEVEGHVAEVSVNAEPAEDDEVEAHFMRASNVRMEAPSNT